MRSEGPSPLVPSLMVVVLGLLIFGRFYVLLLLVLLHLFSTFPPTSVQQTTSSAGGTGTGTGTLLFVFIFLVLYHFWSE
ncbi:hypothetical protein V6N13_098890 [Hibiscus sabdariffa]|uniref:Transmembrane protein n=1 Tax=Hibiscus sabdariffa TaxID=183260 RepID=A0ABR2EF88_9ROSI